MKHRIYYEKKIKEKKKGTEITRNEENKTKKKEDRREWQERENKYSLLYLMMDKTDAITHS